MKPASLNWVTACALRLLSAAARRAALALTLLWWTPSLALMAARLWGGRLRFEVAIGLGRMLVAVGLPAIASRVYAVEIARAERRMRAVEGRPRPDAR